MIQYCCTNFLSPLIRNNVLHPTFSNIFICIHIFAYLSIFPPSLLEERICGVVTTLQHMCPCFRSTSTSPSCLIETFKENQLWLATLSVCLSSLASSCEEELFPFVASLLMYFLRTSEGNVIPMLKSAVQWCIKQSAWTVWKLRMVRKVSGCRNSHVFAKADSLVSSALSTIFTDPAEHL